jgi:hypothetical protein
MYNLALSPDYQGIHKLRRIESRRRLDWRIGLISSVPASTGPVFWTGLSSSGRLPQDHIVGQYPGCPFGGYAQSHLVGVKPAMSPRDLFQPVLDEALLNAGYLGTEGCVTDALAHLSRAVAMQDNRQIKSS